MLHSVPSNEMRKCARILSDVLNEAAVACSSYFRAIIPYRVNEATKNISKSG
jgi:hypothetical protein